MALFRATIPRFFSVSTPIRTNNSLVKSKQIHERKSCYCSAARQNNTFQSTKRISILLDFPASKTALFGKYASRAYSSEMANALVQVSQNLGMGSAAIGLGGASIGIGLVFASFLSAVARNPAFRSQLFTYAIIGFGFVEAMGLFDLMVAMMCKYV